MEPTEENLNKALTDFSMLLAQDPSLASKLQKQAELQEFKEKYEVERATPLKCPACSQWGQTGGSLWRGEEKNRFVCRKCHLEWKVECLTISTEEVILQIKQTGKEA